MIKRHYKSKSILPDNIKKGRFKMAVAVKHLETFLSQKQNTGTVKAEESVSIKEMETCLELNKINPIILSPSDAKDQAKNDDYFQDWYEDELRRIYKRK
jgi:hypothetical protein